MITILCFDAPWPMPVTLDAPEARRRPQEVVDITFKHLLTQANPVVRTWTETLVNALGQAVEEGLFPKEIIQVILPDGQPYWFDDEGCLRGNAPWPYGILTHWEMPNG